jgi:hypothetical protein
MWLVQVIAVLPEALRPGVFLALAVLLVWFVFVRRGLPDLWRAIWRGFAHLIDGGVWIALRLEYAITTARRRSGRTPPKWAFALAPVWDAAEDSATWLYERNRPPEPKRTAEHQQEDEGEESKPPVPRPRKPTVPWVLCVAIVLFFTAAWIAMDELPETSIAKYRFAQVFNVWRDVEEWAGADSGRGTAPQLVRVRGHGTRIDVRVACVAAQQCRGWVLLKARSEEIVAVYYVDMAPGSTRVQLRLTHSQLKAAHGGQVVAVRI